MFCFFKELLVSSRTYLEESETNGDLEVLHPEFNCEADKEMIYDKRKTEASKREREREFREHISLTVKKEFNCLQKKLTYSYTIVC